MQQPKKLGRPQLAPEDRKTYKRISIRPTTHKNIFDNAKQAGENAIDWLDKKIHPVIKKESEIEAELNKTLDKADRE